MRKKQRLSREYSMLSPLNDKLPLDCWHIIEKFLTASDVIRFYLINKACKKAWKENLGFTQIHSTGTNNSRTLIEILKTEKFPHLKNFSTNHLNHELGRLLKKQNEGKDKLKSLKCPINRDIQLISVPASESLKKFEAYRLPPSKPRKKPLRGITNQGIQKINIEFPNLEALLLNQYPSITDAGLDHLNIQSLKEVGLLGCTSITARGIMSLIKRLPALKQLHLTPGQFKERERQQFRELKPDLEF